MQVLQQMSESCTWSITCSIPDDGGGYVYLFGESDEWYGLNVHSILRAEEGKWFSAWNAWKRVAKPLIEKTERTDSIQPRS